jgi:hypothetical protein
MKKPTVSVVHMISDVTATFAGAQATLATIRRNDVDTPPRRVLFDDGA